MFSLLPRKRVVNTPFAYVGIITMTFCKGWVYNYDFFVRVGFITMTFCKGWVYNYDFL